MIGNTSSLISIVSVLILSQSTGWSAEKHEVSLSEVVSLSEKVSHSLSAAELRDMAADASIGIARASYYPTLDLEAIDSTGFPGSSGLAGVGGLMGSPYRSGIAVGVVSRLTVWDFGRTSSNVAAATHEARAQKQDTRLGLYEIDREASKAYLECVRYRTQAEMWSYLLGQSQQMNREVKRFIATGQRSIVEKYLAESQVEEALTSEADFKKRMELSIHRLAIFTGLQENDIICPTYERLSEIIHLRNQDSPENPLISKAIEESQAADERLSAAKAGNLPRVVAVASLGEIEKARLVNKQDYSVGLGITLPLFDGFKTTNEIKRARGLAEERSFLVQAAHEQVDQSNAKLDEVILSSQERLVHLAHELSIAAEGFKVATKRYTSLQGTLVDVREALRNLSRSRTQINEAHLENIEARVAKHLYNGRRSEIVENR